MVADDSGVRERVSLLAQLESDLSSAIERIDNRREGMEQIDPEANAAYAYVSAQIRSLRETIAWRIKHLNGHKHGWI